MRLVKGRIIALDGIQTDLLSLLFFFKSQEHSFTKNIYATTRGVTHTLRVESLFLK